MADLPNGIIIPDYMEPVTGWRAWGVDPDWQEGSFYPELHSVTFGHHVWTARVRQEAVCKKNPDHVPGTGCKCGLYSAKTLDHLMSMPYHQYDADAKGMFHVVGQVALWGDVVEGTQGWRAQYGYPTELFVPYEAWKLATPLADAYGVPVRLKNILNLDPTKEEV